MKLFLKLSVITLLFVVVSCSKKGITLPNLENTTWVGKINTTRPLTLNFQKNGIMKMTTSFFGPQEITGTWQVKEFTFSAQFTDNNSDVWTFTAPISNTELKGTVMVEGIDDGPFPFSVQKQ